MRHFKLSVSLFLFEFVWFNVILSDSARWPSSTNHLLSEFLPELYNKDFNATKVPESFINSHFPPLRNSKYHNISEHLTDIFSHSNLHQHVHDDLVNKINTNRVANYVFIILFCNFNGNGHKPANHVRYFLLNIMNSNENLLVCHFRIGCHLQAQPLDNYLLVFQVIAGLNPLRMPKHAIKCSFKIAIQALDGFIFIKRKKNTNKHGQSA